MTNFAQSFDLSVLIETSAQFGRLRISSRVTLASLPSMELIQLNH